MTEHLAGFLGMRVVFGLLIGFGILLMVLMQYFIPRLSKVVFYIGICFIAAGAIGFLIR